MKATTMVSSLLFASLVVGLVGLAGTACKKEEEASKAKEEAKEPTAHVTTQPDRPKEPAPAKAKTAEELVATFEACWGHFNDKKWDEFKGCYAPDAVSERIDTGMPPAKNVDEIVAMSKAYADAFPDVKGTPQIILAKDQNLVAVVHVAGTHTAPLAGMGPEPIPATNQKIGQLLVHGIEGNPEGKAAREWILFDGTSFMGQLGLLPKGAPFRAASEPGAKVVAIARNDDVEKKNLDAYTASVAAFNQHELEVYKAMSADNIVWSDQSSPKDQSKEEMLADLKDFWAGFSDVKLEPASTWAAGDYVVSIGRITGTNDTDRKDMKKTGKKIDVQYVDLARFKDGKQDAGWLFMNSAAAARQLGLMEPAAKSEKKSK